MSVNRKSTLLFFFALCGILFLCISLSITYGTKTVGFHSVMDALFASSASSFEAKVIQARIPRTIFGVLAGAGLGISGALMQSITRNPIADPSILGVNTGASLFVVCGIPFFHITSGNLYILLAFLGASLTALCVYGLASVGSSGPTPIKLALAGAAASTALQSLVNTVMLPDTQVMDQFRFWQIGSIGAASYADIRLMLPYILVGLVISILLAPSLNTLALGDEVAISLGLKVNLVRGIGAFSGVLLCASITALAGPIGFIGLMIPHFMRMLFGSDMRKLIPFSALGGSCLLLFADVVGRILGRPGELESGIISALLGAPAFILIIRKAKVRAI
ncbi:MAG: iron-siderophore transport system permease protein [Clostridiales bacterium]|nr:iron-siderophore transport system permease protein [Clostridiales bacterium]